MDLLDKDKFYKVLTEPTMENFRFLLQNHTGEEDYLDFKADWESNEKIAKHLLALANSGGGCIVFGVKQELDGTFTIKGLSSLNDPSKLKEGIKGKIPNTLKYHIKDFEYKSAEYAAMKNKKFQLLIVEDDPKNLPFVCCSNGKDIKDGAIYVRDHTESVLANSYQIDEIINRKLNAKKIPKDRNMDLDEHLKQLKILYNELTYVERNGGLIFNFGAIMKNIIGNGMVVKKEMYPKEDYEDFIVRVLNSKKKRIEEELDI